MPTRKVTLSIEELRECVGNIADWAQFIQTALDTYNEQTDASIIYTELQRLPPRVYPCPPPPEDSYAKTARGIRVGGPKKMAAKKKK